MSDELRDSVIGEYEYKEYGDTLKLVLQDNGIIEYYFNSIKDNKAKCSIVDGEIHTKSDDG